jgi:hypothetical protein
MIYISYIAALSYIHCKMNNITVNMLLLQQEYLERIINEATYSMENVGLFLNLYQSLYYVYIKIRCEK